MSQQYTEHEHPSRFAYQHTCHIPTTENPRRTKRFFHPPDEVLSANDESSSSSVTLKMDNSYCHYLKGYQTAATPLDQKFDFRGNSAQVVKDEAGKRGGDDHSYIYSYSYEDRGSYGSYQDKGSYSSYDSRARGNAVGCNCMYCRYSNRIAGRKDRRKRSQNQRDGPHCMYCTCGKCDETTSASPGFSRSSSSSSLFSPVTYSSSDNHMLDFSHEMEGQNSLDSLGRISNLSSQLEGTQFQCRDIHPLASLNHSQDHPNTSILRNEGDSSTSFNQDDNQESQSSYDNNWNAMQIARPGNPAPSSVYSSSSDDYDSSSSSFSMLHSSNRLERNMARRNRQNQPKWEQREEPKQISCLMSTLNINAPPSKIYLHSRVQNANVMQSSRGDPALEGRSCVKKADFNLEPEISPMMLPPSSYLEPGDATPRTRMQKLLNNSIGSHPQLPTQPKPIPVGLSIMDFEKYQLLQTELSSLRTQRQLLQESISSLTARLATQRSELVRTLAISGGDAKDEEFVRIVEMMERWQEEKQVVETKLVEVERVWKRRVDSLEELQRRSGRLTPNLFPGADASSYPNAFSDVPLTSSEASSHPASTPDKKDSLEGQWLTLTKPTYFDCLGFNDDGNPLYRLGRMSFEMFRPGDLVCAIQAVFNPIMEVVGKYHCCGECCCDGNCHFKKGADGHCKNAHGGFSVPNNLKEEVRRALERSESNDDDEAPVLRTYHIVTAFTIEPYSPLFGPDSPNKVVHRPIKGVMTTEGYCLPDPDHPNRMSVWFSGGKIECGEPVNSQGFHVWKRIFGEEVHTSAPRQNRARVSPSARSSQIRRGPFRQNSRTSQQPQNIPSPAPTQDDDDGNHHLLHRRRNFREASTVFLARLFLGASGYDDKMDEETGELKYSFRRPIGGHGKTYVDMLYVDEMVRVGRGHAGTLYVFARVGKKKK